MIGFNTDNEMPWTNSLNSSDAASCWMAMRRRFCATTWALIILQSSCIDNAPPLLASAANIWNLIPFLGSKFACPPFFFFLFFLKKKIRIAWFPVCSTSIFKRNKTHCYRVQQKGRAGQEDELVYHNSIHLLNSSIH